MPFLLYGVAHPRPTTTPLTPDTTLFDYPLIVRWAQAWMHIGPYTSATVHEHPTFMAAWFGLLVTCLNLLPIGQLDGGHVLRAAAGKLQPRVSAVVLALCVIAGITSSAVWLVLPLLMTAVMGLAHPPVRRRRRAARLRPTARRARVRRGLPALFLALADPPGGRHGAGGNSSRNVAGPSLTSSTSIEAPNTPVATVRPWDLSAATNRS